MRYGRMMVAVAKYLRHFEAFFREDIGQSSQVSGKSVFGRDTKQTCPK
jgi:hypothetical protein